MKKLTFGNMQEFIKTVVEGVKKHGLGYKSFYIDCCNAIYYGDYKFESTIAEDMYDNEFPKINFDKIEMERDEKQYSVILKAIDECIVYNQNMEFKTNAFSNTDVALTDLVVSLTTLTEKISKNTTKTNVKKAFDKLDNLISTIGTIPTEITNKIEVIK